MRSSGAQRGLLLISSKPVCALFCASPRRQANFASFRRGYCSSCPPSIPPTLLADHRQLGIEQELFTTSKYSPGSPLFLPNGTRMFNKLTNFLRAQYELFGFQEVITPTIYKKSLWEKSGHWENYKDDMYSVVGRGASRQTENHQQVEKNEEYGLKPMNCPGHCLIFASKKRSFRDLPIRYADFSPLHRNEVSGALSGLTRVRRFHQDDGHIFCRPSQIQTEISKTLEFIKMTYSVFGLGRYRLALSTRPEESFIGSLQEWDNAEKALMQSLEESGQEWVLNEGDGAFYGPKIDVILKDSDGKDHQTATIQLDFQLPKRFGLEYDGSGPDLESATQGSIFEEQGPTTPVLIHRAVLGSVERMMALLIEHYNGRWPFWLNPRQVRIVTVNDDKDVIEHARKAASIIESNLYKEAGGFNVLPRFQSNIKMAQESQRPLLHLGDGQKVQVDIDDSPRSVSKKISEAKRKRYGAIIVVGKKNVIANDLSVDLSGVPSLHEQDCAAMVLGDLLANESAHGISSKSTGAGLTEIKNLNLEPEKLKRVLYRLLSTHL